MGGQASERARKQGVPGAGGVCVIYLIYVYIFIFALVSQFFFFALTSPAIVAQLGCKFIRCSSILIFFFNHSFSTSHFALEKLLCLFFVFY